VILLTLFTSEVYKYLSIDIKSNMLVDISHHDDRLNINIDIFFPKMPCQVLSLDVQDVMGTHIVDIAGSLYKRKYSKDGDFISEVSIHEKIENRMELMNKIKEEIDQ
jgi:hypothetical protein